MPGSLKGGIFVGAAVAAGLLFAFLVPPLVTGRATADRQSSDAPSRPAMPDVVGMQLDDAERQLARRRIAYVTDGGDIFGVVVPALWEVCDTAPRAGTRVRGTARVRAALTGTCAI